MLVPKHKVKKWGIPPRSNYSNRMELGEGLRSYGTTQVVSNLKVLPPTGSASITGSDAGIVVTGNLNKVKFLKENGDFVAGMQIDSTDSLEIVTEATGSVGQNIELFAEELLYLYSANANIGVNPGGGVLYPYAAGIDIGTASTFFDDVNAKTFTDRACPSPIIMNPLQRIKQMKRFRKQVTIEEAKSKGLSKKIQKAIVEAGGTKELEDWDYGTLPEEALSRPSEEDNIFAEKVYQDRKKRAAKREKQGYDTEVVEKPKPETGIISNYLLYTTIMALQEVAAKVDALEEKNANNHS